MWEMSSQELQWFPGDIKEGEWFFQVIGYKGWTGKRVGVYPCWCAFFNVNNGFFAAVLLIVLFSVCQHFLMLSSSLSVSVPASNFSCFEFYLSNFCYIFTSSKTHLHCISSAMALVFSANYLALFVCCRRMTENFCIAEKEPKNLSPNQHAPLHNLQDRVIVPDILTDI